MSSEYMVPAMRDAAEKLRSDATALVAAAEIEARQHFEEAKQKATRMQEDAARISALADGEELRQREEQQGPPPSPGQSAPCKACGRTLQLDALGWGHVSEPEQAACPGPNPPQPAPPTAPFETVPAEQNGGQQ